MLLIAFLSMTIGTDDSALVNLLFYALPPVAARHEM